MKNLVLATLVGFGVALSGCTTPKHNYQPISQNISKPPINSINVANIGDKMLTQGTYTEREALHIKERKSAFGGVFVNKGYFLKTGEDAKGSYYQARNDIPDGGSINSPNIGLVLLDNGEICILTAFSTKDCKLKLNGEKTKVSVASDNSFQQTLIYNGKVGNKINIGYREFSSSLARPAFNNDVEYDLSESKTIGYKGALLEVIEANNQSIKYKVLKNFNKVD
ncbi:hypothetical protein [Acinetobacter gerneri]|uniref:hypothetical protein n=1 Tax=Acinetobacter gerneri TaxID=202952 RepID=UPI0028A6B8A7|nr:hypothetical protein [Acinetobacter gerneri]